MNELHEKFEMRGLVVVGVSNESKELIDEFVATHGVRHPILRIEGDAFENTIGANGFPSAFLVDPDGDIVWNGHPGMLEESTILAHLKAARPLQRRLPAAFESLQPLYEQGAMGLVHRELRGLIEVGLPDQDRADAERFLAVIERESRQIEKDALAAASKRDYPTACRLLRRLIEQFDGVRDLSEAQKKQKELLGDARVRKEVEGWERLEAARALEAAHDFRKALAAYVALRRGYAKTRAAYEAEMAELRIKNKGLLQFDKNCPDCAKAGEPCTTHRRRK